MPIISQGPAAQESSAAILSDSSAATGGSDTYLGNALSAQSGNRSRKSNSPQALRLGAGEAVTSV